jgi:tetratricopeptide (TPR) repeat protein
MTNPYSPPATSARRVPTASLNSRLATMPQFAILGLFIVIGWLATKSVLGIAGGAVAYVICSYSARALIPRAHRRGTLLARNEQFEEAIRAHEESYAFFTRHAWIDRYRAITMLTPSAMSYREIALVNIAFAYSQMGDGAKAKEFYRRALDEFPDSGLASASLKLIEAVERSHGHAEVGESGQQGKGKTP